MKTSIVLSIITIAFATIASVVICVAVPVTDEPISTVMVLLFRTGFLYIVWVAAAIVLVVVWLVYLVHLYLKVRKNAKQEDT